MPRWLQIAVTLALFTLVMLLVRWGLHETVPPFVDWLDAKIGMIWAWALFIVGMLVCAFVAYWPRNADGSMRRLSR